MKTVKVHQATNAQLDWLVTYIEMNRRIAAGEYVKGWWKTSVLAGGCSHQYSTDPAFMCEISEREKIGHTYHDEWDVPNWGAWVNEGNDRGEVMGETALIADARAYVMKVVGGLAGVPDCLA
jgi:Protein of unknown function (DUF2591)